MAKKMRVWPYRITSTTLVIATTAPSARIARRPADAGALVERGRERRVAVLQRRRGGDAERADRGEHVEDRADQQRTDDRRAAGRVAGLRASSLPVETASNPMYAKKMIAAAVVTPSVPCGRNGVKLLGAEVGERDRR